MRYLILLLCVLISSNVFAEETDIIYTDSTTRSTVDSKAKNETTLKSPPPSAITPTINTSNSDLCTFGVAGAIQTQILGISTGTQVTDENCERLKLSKTLYDMGMKVAAVSTLCQDRRVFDAMMMAGTPCPYDGLIGVEAKNAWETDEELQPIASKNEKGMKDGTKTLLGGAGVASLLILLLI